MVRVCVLPRTISLACSASAKVSTSVLPGAKVTAEIAAARGVKAGEAWISPARHTAFRTPVGVVQFMPELAVPGLRHILGVADGVMAILTAVAGLRRWAQVDRAMRHDEPLPRAAVPTYLTAGLAMMGLVTVGVAIVATIR